MCECVESKIRQEVNELMRPYRQEKDNLIQKCDNVIVRETEWLFCLPNNHSKGS